MGKCGGLRWTPPRTIDSTHLVFRLGLEVDSRLGLFRVRVRVRVLEERCLYFLQVFIRVRLGSTGR